MKNFKNIAVLAAVALAISACSDSDAPESGEVSETRMDDVDVIDGTISDEMVDVDTITEVDATSDEAGDSSAAKEETASTAKGDSEAEAAD